MSSADQKAESFAALLAESEQRAPKRGGPRTGERIEGVVVKVGRDAVFVELDGKQEGFIDRAAVTEKDGTLAVEVGTKVVAKVVEIGGKAGGVRLEPLVIKKAADEASAQAAPSADQVVIAEGIKVTGEVTRVERYGVFVQIKGTQGKKGRGLLPAQETGAPRNADLNKLFPVGTVVECKIVRVEDDGKIRLSITALKRDEERGEYEKFNKGDRQKGDKGREQPEQRIGTFGALLLSKMQKK